METIQVGDLMVEIILKDIKNIHLSVHPPAGRVRIAAPKRVRIETLRVYVISKMGWIRAQQKKLLAQQRETTREYVERESHFVWGRRVLLSVSEVNQKPSVELQHNRLLLSVRPGTSSAAREKIVTAWYREQLREAMQPIFQKWEAVLGVSASEVGIRTMKTRWGSCAPSSRRILLNSELAKKKVTCLEYVIVHELVHLLEPSHNARFLAYMDKFMPQWRQLRDELNHAPLGHVEWEY